MEQRPTCDALAKRRCGRGRCTFRPSASEHRSRYDQKHERHKVRDPGAAQSAGALTGRTYTNSAAPIGRTASSSRTTACSRPILACSRTRALKPSCRLVTGISAAFARHHNSRSALAKAICEHFDPLCVTLDNMKAGRIGLRPSPAASLLSASVLA